MVYNPELVKQLLGEQVAELFDGTVEIVPSKGEKLAGSNLVAGDSLIFNFKNTKAPVYQFVITSGKKNG